MLGFCHVPGDVQTFLSLEMWADSNPCFHLWVLQPSVFSWLPMRPCACFWKLFLLFTTLPCSSRSFSCCALQATSPRPVPGTLNTRNTFCLQNIFSASLLCVARAPRVTLFNTCASTRTLPARLLSPPCPPSVVTLRPAWCQWRPNVYCQRWSEIQNPTQCHSQAGWQRQTNKWLHRQKKVTVRSSGLAFAMWKVALMLS